MDLSRLDKMSQELADGLLLALEQAERDFDKGQTTIKQLTTVARLARRFAAKPWRTIYKLSGTLQKRAATAKRKIGQDNDRKALAHPAPPCPYCSDPMPNMATLIEHLKLAHGWLKEDRRGLEHPHCACGVGDSWGTSYKGSPQQNECRANLARHLIHVGDLENHLALAVIKAANKVSEES